MIVESLVTKSSLSGAKKRLVELMQLLNFGRIENLCVRGSDPIFDPPPRLVKDVKLAALDNGARPELTSTDFALKREHTELFRCLGELGHGTVDLIEIKAGLPFRICIEQHFK